jgi:hypothetical protein
MPAATSASVFSRAGGRPMSAGLSGSGSGSPGRKGVKGVALGCAFWMPPFLYQGEFGPER